MICNYVLDKDSDRLRMVYLVGLYTSVFVFYTIAASS